LGLEIGKRWFYLWEVEKMKLVLEQLVKEEVAKAREEEKSKIARIINSSKPESKLDNVIAYIDGYSNLSN
jgi:hypothetical protein